MNKASGFTLIELIIVIVILGILAVTAAPRFIDFTEDANTATFRATGAAFREGVNQVHLAWLLRGNGQAVQDFITIGDADVGGNLSVNAQGYPADTRGSSLSMNSQNDCLDVWRAVLDSFSADVGTSDDTIYAAEYNAPASCTYSLVADDTKTVVYNSETGAVTINF